MRVIYYYTREKLHRVVSNALLQVFNYCEGFNSCLLFIIITDNIHFFNDYNTTMARPELYQWRGGGVYTLNIDNSNEEKKKSGTYVLQITK